MNYHIIGCGSVGSLLTLKLIDYIDKDKSYIYLYDYDLVTKDEFCFCRNDIGEYKIDILAEKLSFYDVNVVKRYEEIKEFKKDRKGIVIDCRDNKINLNKIYSDLRVSMDYTFLIIDTRKNIVQNKAFYKYRYPKNKYIFDLGILMIINFIKLNMYKKDNNLYIYDIQNILEKGKVFYASK